MTMGGGEENRKGQNVGRSRRRRIGGCRVTKSMLGMASMGRNGVFWVAGRDN